MQDKKISIEPTEESTSPKIHATALKPVDLQQHYPELFFLISSEESADAFISDHSSFLEVTSERESHSPRKILSSSPKLTQLLGRTESIKPEPAKPTGKRKSSIKSLFFPRQNSEENVFPSPTDQSFIISFNPAEIKQINKFTQFNKPFDLKEKSIDKIPEFSLLDLQQLMSAESATHRRFAQRFFATSQDLSTLQGEFELPQNGISEDKISELVSFLATMSHEQSPINEAASSSLLAHKRQISAYDSSRYDDMLETMKKLFMLSIKRGFYEAMLCIFIMRDIYSLVQQLKATTTAEANASSNNSTKAQIINLTFIVYTFFLEEGCPFPVNFPAKNTEIRAKWHEIFAANLATKDTAKIPPLEIMLEELNGLVADTQLNTEIAKLNSELEKTLTITNIHKCLTDQEKTSLHNLFDALTLTGCPRRCPPLFSVLEHLLQIRSQQQSPQNKKK